MKFSLEHIKEQFDFWANGSLLTVAERDFLKIFNEALTNENETQLKDFFRFWDDREERLSIDKLARNYVAYQRGLKFGFTNISFDSYGWLKNEDWAKIEEIEFKAKNSYLTNKITLGKGQNGMWGYGLHYGSAFSGGAFGLCVHYNIFDSYDQVLEIALKDILNRINKENPNPNAELKEIIKQIQYRLTAITKIDENNQLSIF